MDFQSTVQKYRSLIDSELCRFFNDRIAEAPSADISALLGNLKEFNLRGGKRLRPILAIIAYKSFGGKDEKAMIKAAISIELMQSFLLMHDDIMDQSETRRNGPTMHKIYGKTGGKTYGESVAIDAGDLLAALANEVLSQSNFSDEKKIKVMRKFNEVIKTTCYGQFLDLNSAKKKMTESDIAKIHQAKTAAYTIEGPLHIGAILAGAKESELTKISNFAIPLGQAFQIQDDIIGMFGDEEKTGKPIDSDLKEGKKTLLIIHALENSSEKQRKKLLAALGNKNLSRSQFAEAQKIIAETGSLDYSVKTAKNLIDISKKELFQSKLSREGKEFLTALADYVINRSK